MCMSVTLATLATLGKFDTLVTERVDRDVFRMKNFRMKKKSCHSTYECIS